MAAIDVAAVSAALDAAVVRLLDTDGHVCGTGFLATDRLVVTCAHVVDRAGGSSRRSAVGGETVVVDFPLVARDRRVTATIVRIIPPDADNAADIAVLELDEDRPNGSRPAPLVVSPDLWDHPFRAFGFPVRRDDGVWATGRLRGPQAAGWVQMESSSAVGYRVEQGFSGAPVWDDELDGVVGMAVASDSRADVRAAYLIPTSSLIVAWPALEDHAVPPCPYRGLAAFREQDAELFFGREDLARQLADFVTAERLVGVVGPSGSGKSSLVFAGLMPVLRRRADWVIADCRPGKTNAPFSSTASALLPLLQPSLSEVERLQRLPDLADVVRDGRLHEVVDRVLDRSDGQRLLLVLDQFEELYGDPVGARRFTDVLLDTVGARWRADGGLTVLLTLRADFLGQALEHAELAKTLQRAVLVTGSMTRDQLEQAIVGPLPPRVTYEAGLVDRILSDLGEGPGNLPLLEFALTLLWERQDRGRLTHRQYEALGGVDGALAQYAEQVYRDGLQEHDRVDAQRVFAQLVRPGDATEHTRRVAQRVDFDDDRWQVAQRLAATRLIVTGRDPAGTETVELVHEALISGWKRLHEWVETDREFRSWQERLRVAQREWERNHHDPGALLRGAPLAEAERWLHRRSDQISDAESQFIDASQRQQIRGVRRLRALVAGLAILAVFATGLAYWANIQRREARRQQQTAEEQRQAAAESQRRSVSVSLASYAERIASVQPDLSILLSLQAHKVAATPQAQRSIINQIGRWSTVDRLLVGGEDITDLAMTADGQRLVTVDRSCTATVWDASTDWRRSASRSFAEDARSTCVVSARGDRAAIADRSRNEVDVWDHRDDSTRSFTAPGERVQYITLSPSGRRFLARARGGAAVIIDVASGTSQRIDLPVFGIRDWLPTFTADDRLLHVVRTDDSLALRDAERGNTISMVTAADLGRKKIRRGATAVAISDNGRHVLVANHNNGRLHVWDAKHGTVELAPRNIQFWSDIVAFQGTRATLPAALGLLTIDVERMEVVGLNVQLPTVGPSGPFGFFEPPLAVGVDNVALGHRDTVQLLGSRSSVAPVRGAAVPGRPIRAATTEGGLEVWIGGRRHHIERRGFDGERIRRIAVTPDARTAATATKAGHISVWDLEQGQWLGDIARPIEKLSGLAFSADGETIIASRRDHVDLLTWTVADLDGQAGSTRGCGDGGVASLWSGRDGAHLVDVRTGGGRSMLCLWDTRSEPVPAGEIELDGNARGLAVGPRTLVASVGRGEAGSVQVWNIGDAEPTQADSMRLGRSSGGDSVALSPDESMVAVAGSSGVLLWDLERDEEIGVLVDNSGFGPFYVENIAFNNDGSVLHIGVVDDFFGSRAQVPVQIDVPEAVPRLCDVVRRNLSRQEWDEFLPDRAYEPTCE